MSSHEATNGPGETMSKATAKVALVTGSARGIGLATAKRFLAAPQARCPKCDSTYVGREPAFIHCRLCGKLARIADAPLELQELWEIRSGLRIAS